MLVSSIISCPSPKIQLILCCNDDFQLASDFISLAALEDDVVVEYATFALSSLAMLVLTDRFKLYIYTIVIAIGRKYV